MKKLIIMRGIPGSGKTTKANELMKASPDSVRCSADDFPGYYLSGSYQWSQETATLAYFYCRNLFLHHLAKGTSLIVVDNMHIKKRDYKFFKKEAIKNGYEVEICEIPFDKTQVSLYTRRNLHGITEERMLLLINKYQPEENNHEKV